MTARRSSYEELAAGRRDSDEYREGYAEARRAFLIGQVVRERRLTISTARHRLPAPLPGLPVSGRAKWLKVIFLSVPVQTWSTVHEIVMSMVPRLRTKCAFIP